MTIDLRKPQLFDLLVIGYCLLMVALLLAFGRPLTEYGNEIVFYSSMAAIAVLCIRFCGGRIAWPFRFVRLLYPMLMFTWFYRMTGGLMMLFFDSWFDPQVVAFETALFGIEPSLWFDQHLPQIFITELLSFCYGSYYVMIPGFLLPLFALRRERVIVRSMAAICLAFFVSYLLFALYPLEGPRWHLAGQYQHAVEGRLFRGFVEYVIATGAVHGGCMPSSHVAVALVIMCYAWKMNRPLGITLLIIDIGMAVGTVWGRFHYTSDAVVGAILGLGAVWLIERTYAHPPLHRETSPQPEIVHAA